MLTKWIPSSQDFWYVEAFSTIEFWALQVESKALQWIPSNPATLGTNQSVQRGVASFQGENCIIKEQELK